MNDIDENLEDSTHSVVARHLAHRLNDPKSLVYYEILAKTYPHTLLLDLLAGVLQIPDEKITTSRAAIFVANVKRHEPRK